MAGEADIFAALGNDDLAAFSQQLTARSVPGQLGNVVNSFKFDNSTWSPKQSATTAFLQGLIGGGLNQYAKNDVAQQMETVTGLLPQLYSNPDSVAVPEGVDSQAFNLLKGSAMLKNRQSEALQAQKLRQMLAEAGIAGIKKKAEVMGENEGWLATVTPGETPAVAPGAPAGIEGAPAPAAAPKTLKNPNNPIYKEEQRLKELQEGKWDDLRKTFEAKDEVKQWSMVDKAAGIINKALADPKAVSDLELVRYAILLIEPGMAVREGEQASVMATASIPQRWKGMMSKALRGEAELTDDVRSGLKNLATRAYEGHRQKYDETLSFYQKVAKLKGIDPDMISYLGKSQPFAERWDSGNNAPPPSTQPGTTDTAIVAPPTASQYNTPAQNAAAANQPTFKVTRIK